MSISPLASPRPAIALTLLLILLWSAGALAQPTADVSIGSIGDVAIGEDFSFSVTFDNTSGTATDIGYGPFIDLYVPTIGADGAGVASDDGITINGASYLSSAVAGSLISSVTFPASPLGLAPCGASQSAVEHPFALDLNGDPRIVCGTPGETLVTIELPFGSFTPDQPAAELTINASLSEDADAGTDLFVRARGGYRFGGQDPLDNFCCDEVVLTPNITDASSWPGQSLTPTVLTASKSQDGPEGETATGPNFPRAYTLTVNIPEGQTVSNVAVTDYLPDDIVITGITSSETTSSVTLGVSSPSTLSLPLGAEIGPLTNNNDDNVLTLNYASLTGPTSGSAVAITINFYVPRQNASGAEILSPTTGNDATTLNRFEVNGNWTPLDTRDDPTTVSVNGDCPSTCPEVAPLEQKSIAIQKGVSTSTVVPGDRVTYTLEIQVSDFFAFEDLAITDVLSDGQRVQTGLAPPDLVFEPQISVTRDGNTLSGPMAPGNFAFSVNEDGNGATPATDGSTTLTFDLAAELLNQGFGTDNLLGGCIPDGGTGLGLADCGTFDGGPTTVTITYQAEVLDEFTDTFPSGDRSVDHGDTLSNSVSISGGVLNPDNLTSTSQPEDDTSGAGLTVEFGDIVKSIYALNGSTTLPTPFEVEPGDVVTFRLEYTLPSSDYEDLTITDFLPLPVFDAATISTTFDASTPSAAAPAAGQAKYGPGDTFNASNGALATTPPTPTITTDGTGNTVNFNYPTYDDANNTDTTIDILFSVEVTDEPYADQLFLTNQALATEETTNAGQQSVSAIVSLEARSPDFAVSKGVTDTNNPNGEFIDPETGNTISGAALGQTANSPGTIDSGSLVPADADVTGLDAGDTIDFTITIENQGGAGAYDLVLRDTLPPGLIEPASGYNLTIRRGDGLDLNTLGWVGATSGTPNSEADFFAGGIRLNDPAGGQPVCQKIDATPGANIILVTYTLEVRDVGLVPRQIVSNFGGITDYSTSEGGPSHVDQGNPPSEPPDDQYRDSASVTIDDPVITKTVDSISPNGSGLGTVVTAGDIVTYRFNVTLPEGTLPGLVLTDTLPSGFQYVTGSVNVDPAGFVGILDLDPTVTTSGQDVIITFDSPNDTVVTGNNDPTDNNFDVTLQALVLDDALNDGLPGVQTKTNTVSLNYTGFIGDPVDDDVDLSFGEPDLVVDKEFSPNNNLSAGDTVTISLTVTNNGTTPAYDIVVTDVLNEDIANPNDNVLLDLSTVTDTTTGVGASAYTFAFSSPTVTYSANTGVSLNGGDSVTFTFTATVQDNVVTGSTFVNEAEVAGDSQDGTVPNERTTDDTESDNAVVTQAGVNKSVIATSETWTIGTNSGEVAIGEVVTYRLTFTFPEGVTRTSSDPIIRDRLPTGFQYISGTATIRGEYDNTNAGEELRGSVYGVIPTTATSYTPTIENGGRDLQFDLGDIINNDNLLATDPTANERIIIELDALVLNTSDNQRDGSNKSNQGRLRYLNREGNPQNRSNNANVIIAEPNLTISKTASPGTAAGGETITFNVVITNTSGANVTRAWELDVLDVLPTDYTLGQSGSGFPDPALVSATLDRTGDDLTAPTCGGFSGRTLALTLDCVSAAERYLDPGDTITLQYTATLDPGIAFQQVITNTVDVETTSLPGPDGSYPTPGTPGTPGDDDGERTGGDRTGNGTSSENDLSPSDNATVTAERPSITKTVADPTLQIGDTTRVTIEIPVPVGQTTGFNLSDDLPAGLRYIGNLSVVESSPQVTSTLDPTASPPAAGTDPVVLDFGDVQNSSAIGQTITIEYDVQVENVIANQNGVTLTNTATLDYDTLVGAPPSDTADITVLEPDLELTKTITTGATGSDAGDTVSYEFTVRNNNATSTAYRVNLSDVIPPELLGGSPTFSNVTLTNPGGAAVLNSDGTTPLASSDHTISTTTNTDDTLGFPLFDLPGGVTLTVSYDVVVVNDAPTGALLTNTLTVDYNSRSDGTGRDNTDSNDDDDANLDNYGETITRDLTLDATIALQKSLASGQPDSNFAIGEEVLFDLRVDVLEGVTGNVEVVDTLPTGLAFVTLEGITAASNISYAGPGTAVEAPTGTITVDMDTVTNLADADTTNDFFIIQLRVRVENISGNQSTDTLTNTTDVTSDAGSDSDTLDITVVEPDLEILKVADTSTPTLGDIVTYTVTVRHTGASTSDAFEVVLTDLIPTGLSLVGSSTTGEATADETDPTQPIFDLGTITRTGDIQKVFSYQVTVDNTAVVGQDLINTITGVYTSTPGDNVNERDGSDGPSGLNNYEEEANETVTPGIDAFIDATKTVSISTDLGTLGEVNPDDELLYTITLTNTSGTVTATNVLFSDPIPANTSYVAASLSGPAGSTPDDSGDPLTVAIPSIGPGSSVNISFRVTVDSATPDGTIISNQGVVDSDQTVPEPTDRDGVDDNGDQPTTIPVGEPPALTDSLYVEKTVGLLIDADGSGSITPGDTVRYLVVLENLGGDPLTGVTFNTGYPPGLTYVPGSALASQNNGGITDSPTLNWNAGSIPAFGFATLTFDMTVDGPSLFDSSGGIDPNNETFFCQGTGDSNETDPVLSDGNGDRTDGPQPTPFTAVDSGPGSPILDVEKRVSLAVDSNGNGLVDPLDVLEYRVTIQNIGSATATDVRFSDPVPADTTLVGSVSTSQGAITNSNPIQVNLGDLPAGDLAQVIFRVEIDNGTADGTIISNQATVTDTAGPSNEPSDDNGRDGDGKNPTTTPVVGGGTSGSGTPSGLDKVLISTSEPDSTGTDVLIGEVATYEVRMEMPIGTTREVTILDTLPVGLRFVPGSGELIRTFDTNLTASEFADIGSTAPQPLTDTQVTTDPDGRNLAVFLGDVINSDNDANAEIITLRYDVVVENIAANQEGDILTNEASLSFLNGLNQVVTLTPDTADLRIIEPALLVTKSASPTVIVPPSGTSTFTFTITHPAGANVGPAYNLRLTDTFSDWTSFTLASVTTTPSGGVSGVSNASTLAGLDIRADSFPVGGQLIVTIEATGNGSAGDFLDNTGTITWTSLPGPQGTGSATPGNSGDPDGERTGDGGVNDHTTNDSARVTVGDVQLDKEIRNLQSRYAIGDIVDYRLTLTLPPNAVLENSLVEDALDAGLVYVTGSLSDTFQDGDISASNAITDFSVSGTTLSLDLGTFRNANLAEPRTLILDYQARVANVLTNQNNTTLNNTATLDFNLQGDATPQERSDNDALQVGEPTLTLLKTITSPTIGLDAGDTVDFQVEISNTGTTTAYEVVLSDTLPTGLENLTGLSASATGSAETPTFSTFTTGDSSFVSDGFDVPVGDTVTVVFTATLSNTVVPNQTLQNQVLADYTSRDGADPNERDGSSIPTTEQDDDTVLDNYNTSDLSPTITVDADVSLDKAFSPDGTDTDYTIGEQIGYRLTLEIIEGTLNNVVLTDTLPNDVTLISRTLGTGNMGITTGGFSNSDPVDLSGQVLTLDLGTVTNPADGDDSNDFLTVDIIVQVDNVLANQDGVILGNNARVEYLDFTSTTQTIDYDADLGTPGIQPLDATVVEPNLLLDKSADRSTVSLGDEVVFTLDISHSAASGSDAFDLVLVDTLPAGLSFVPGSATVAPTSVVGQVITFSISNLTETAGSTSISFSARAELDAVVDLPIDNSATLTYAGLPGANGDADDGRNGEDGPSGLNDYEVTDTETVTPVTDAFIDATKTVSIAVDGGISGQVDPGDVLEYTVTITNTNGPVSNVVFSDPIPDNTSYVPGSLQSSVGGEDDSGDPLRVAIGTLGSNASVSISFRVTVAADTVPGTLIINQGSVDSDQTVPEPTDEDGVDRNGDQPTEIPVSEPPPDGADLYATKVVDLVGDNDASGSITVGDTLQYTIVLENTGDVALSNVVFDSGIPVGLSSVLGSGFVTGTGSTVSVTTTGVSATIPGIPVGGIEVVTFEVTVNDPLDNSRGDGLPDQELFPCQGTATADQILDPVLTDGNGDPNDGPQTTDFTAIRNGPGTPLLTQEKRVSLSVDLEEDQAAGPGDVLNYRITVGNIGSAAATNVIFTDTLPSGVTLVGSATASEGTVLSSDPVEVNLGTVDVGALVNIDFQVRIDAGAMDGDIISNQSFISREGDPTPFPSDDNGNPDDGRDPTDIPVQIPDFDYGDAADGPYPTLNANRGARHVIQPGLYLGSCVDAEDDGQPSAGVDGDDTASGYLTEGTCANDDDEDGVVFGALIRGITSGVAVTANQACVLNAWIDWNGNGSWLDAGEQIATDISLVAGVNTLALPVPINAVDNTVSRFRCSTDAGLSPTGTAPDGEVEDHPVQVFDALELDLGDAPNNGTDGNYPTVLADAGASHQLGGPIQLGRCVDAEADGQPQVFALGDDRGAGSNIYGLDCAVNNDDEDGVRIGQLIPGSNSRIRIIASNACVLNAWMDWNGDGDWNDADEQIFTDRTLTAGELLEDPPVPASATPGITYARFRCASETGLTPYGFSADGEVEDYQVTIQAGAIDEDLGDNPDAYQTLTSSVGASHVIGSGPILGTCVDGETDGQPSVAADGDDTTTGAPVVGTCTANDDEDGVQFLAPELVPGDLAEINVTVTEACYLNAWIDFAQDGSFNEPGDQVAVDIQLPLTAPGVPDLLQIPIPVGTPPGDSYARFRCSSRPGVDADGAAPDGEVEDYPVLVSTVTVPDFGDAPAGFPTLLADDGARHFQDDVTYLGSCVDVENDGQPSATASGDDETPSAPEFTIGRCTDDDDEDGVVFTTTLVPNLVSTVEVTASAPCTLSAWIDFNGDGNWSTPGDELFPGGVNLVAGVNSLNFTVPGTATLGAEAAARFRCTTDGPVSFTGLAGDGEVEDYLEVISGPDMVIVKSLDSEFNRAVGEGRFRFDTTNQGTLATQGPVTVEDTLPSGLTPLEAQGTGWSCSITGQTMVCENTAVVEPGASLPSILLTVAIASDTPTQLVNIATVSTPLDADTSNDADEVDVPIFTRMAAPSGAKTVRSEGFSQILWRMVWINPDNVLPTQVSISDVLPPGLVLEEFSCQVDGLSVEQGCRYDPPGPGAPSGTVQFEGIIAPDPGRDPRNAVEELANEVIIEIRTRYVAWDGETLFNQGIARYDEDDDGEIDEISVPSNDPETPDPLDPTAFDPPVPLAIPTLSTLAMGILGMLLLLAGLRVQRQGFIAQQRHG